MLFLKRQVQHALGHRENISESFPSSAFLVNIDFWSYKLWAIFKFYVLIYRIINKTLHFFKTFRNTNFPAEYRLFMRRVVPRSIHLNVEP